MDELNRVYDDDSVKKVSDVDLYLADVWEGEKEKLKLVLFAKQSYTDSHKKLCDVIDAYLSKEEYYEVIHPNQAFMAYKILQKSV